MIFPLSVEGKIVLILIAIFLGLIFWMLSKPNHWRWLRKNKTKKVSVEKIKDKEE